eukprot:8557738-Pyramimonas_sp.AAC.1
MMKYRGDFRGKFWKAKGGQQEQLLRPRAWEALEDLEPLGPGGIQRAARLFREGSAVGVDQWPPRLLVSLPP